MGKSPEWVSAQSQVKKFRLYRQIDYDAALEGEMPDDAERRFKDVNVSGKDDRPYISQFCLFGTILLA
jgi:hypothetical protein